MSDLRDGIKRILDEDAGRWEPVKGTKATKQEHQREAVDAIGLRVSPAFEAAKEAFLQSGIPMKTTAQLKGHPRVTAEIRRIERSPLHLVIALEALPDAIHVRVQIGRAPDVKHHDFPGGFENLTRETIIAEILKCYRQSLIDDARITDDDSSPKSVVQGSV